MKKKEMRHKEEEGGKKEDRGRCPPPQTSFAASRVGSVRLSVRRCRLSLNTATLTTPNVHRRRSRAHGGAKFAAAGRSPVFFFYSLLTFSTLPALSNVLRSPLKNELINSHNVTLILHFSVCTSARLLFKLTPKQQFAYLMAN